MTMKAPEAPGNYIAFFRFVHGDSNRFGQKVWCDILVQANPFAASKPQVVEMMAAGKQVEPVEERSSLLDDSMQLEQEIQMNASPILQFEYVCHEVKDEIQQLEDKFEEKPAAELFLSHIEEPVLKNEEEKQEIDPLMKSEPSAEDLERIVYLEKLAKVKDNKIVENMMQLLDMGYSVFEVNLNLLNRNKNDLIMAVNNICNGNVTESMFN